MRVNLTPAQRHPATSSSTHYALKQVVGKGAYGIVYRAINRQTQKEVAIKVIEYDDEEELNEHMLEIDLLKNLRHQNIVKYHGFIQKSHQLYILLEYCSQGSLRDLVKRGPLDESDAKTFIRQTLEGLKYLHEQGVIHRDIKAANLLLDSRNVVKLADFGVSTRVNNLAMTYAGSPNWMAPEVMLGQGASTVSDIWSLGATVVEILTGNPPFHNLVNEAACYAIVHDSYIPPKSLSSSCRRFLSSCFQKNLFKRPRALELLNHEWLSETKQSILERFKEPESDNWDSDFIEVEVSPSKDHDIHDEQYYLKQLTQARVECHPHLIFSECDLGAVVSCLIDLCKRGQMKNVKEMFTYDLKYNEGRCRSLFITIGGLTYLLNHCPVVENILSECFINDMREMIKCGILAHCKSFSDPLLILSISSTFHELVDYKIWCQWCSQLPNMVESIIYGLENNEKMAEDILLKLSASSLFPMDKYFLSKLMALPLRNNLRLKYTILKSFNNLLERKEEQRENTIESFDSRPPVTPLSTSLPLSTPSVNIPVFPPQSTLPDRFMDWLLKSMPSATDDPHLIKNFIELCYNSSHLNQVSLGEIVEHREFIKLVKQLAQQLSGDLSIKYMKSLLLMALQLCVELSQEVNETTLSDMIDVSLQFLLVPEFATGGIDILLHCLQFALHERFKIYEDTTDIVIVVPSGDIRVPHRKLLQTFYSEEVKFGNFIPKFTKLCSLPPCNSLSYEIIIHKDFMDKVRSLFDLYRSSLIIQIDFLKFLKIVLTRYAEFMPQSKRKDISSEKLLSTGMKHAMLQPNANIIRNVANFLHHNWQIEKAQKGQVGADSVLIKQLCQDIELLQHGELQAGNKLIDKDGFAIPKFNPI